MKIQQAVSDLVKNQKVTLSGLEKAYKELGQGKSITRPGDAVVKFENAALLAQETFRATAELQSLQGRITWFQNIQTQLQRVDNILSEMLHLARASADPTVDDSERSVFDANFQEFKKELSQLIDGESGRKSSFTSFSEMPQLMGNFVPTDLGANSLFSPLDEWSVNLFTNYAPPEESNASVLTATASFDSLNQIQLPQEASYANNYYVGVQFTVTAGSGIGQSAVITAYDAPTQIATFSFLGTATPDKLIGAGVDQSTVELNLEARFADEVWGAQNMNVHLSPEERNVFIPLTSAEIDFRADNGIMATDLIPRTDEEILARDRRNIFSADYGNVVSTESALIMSEQLSNAFEQIAFYQTKVSGKLENLTKQYSFDGEKKQWQEEGISVLEDVDMALRMEDVQALSLAHQKILELSMRLSESYGRLNQLIDNRGVIS